MKLLFQFFKNKYLIAALAFAGWMFFYDQKDIPSQIALSKDYKELITKINYYKEQVKLTEAELKNLQNDPVALEKYAREKYFMKKDNEEVFKIE